MSVLIKGMEMPECCYDCPFIRASVAGDFYCVAGDGIEEDLNKLYERRMSDCPLVEIPPHGDLVDRSKLIAEYDHQHKGSAGGARRIMVDAKAVVKADGYPREWVDWQTKGREE